MNRGQIRVLNIVNSDRPFLTQTIKSIRDQGIKMDTVKIPGEHEVTNGETSTRSVIDYIKGYFKILSELDRNYDIIHVHYGIIAPLALAQPVRPVVVSLWGSDLMGRYAGVTQASLRFCNEVISRSTEMDAIANSNTTVIPHGVDFDKFKPLCKEKCQEELGWDKNSKHVLFPYDPTREVKNYPLAEGVVEQVQKTIEEEVTLHSCSGIKHSLMPRYMNASDAMILSSYREGSPNTVKEAMACNLPIVSTDVGDVHNLLDQVDASYVCSNKTDLERSLSLIIQKELQSNGRQAVRHLSLESTATEIIDVYNRALGQNE